MCVLAVGLQAGASRVDDKEAFHRQATLIDGGTIDRVKTLYVPTCQVRHVLAPASYITPRTAHFRNLRPSPEGVFCSTAPRRVWVEKKRAAYF